MYKIKQLVWVNKTDLVLIIYLIKHSWVIDSFIVKHNMTDHFPIILQIDVKQMQKKSNKIVSTINYKKLWDMLHSENWYI